MDSAKTPSRRLSNEDAVAVWLLHWEGHFQNRIAAMFDVNPGRINEILKGHRHQGSKAEAAIRRSAA